jgi:E3 ubiquitin-protein ligase NEDD4
MLHVALPDPYAVVHLNGVEVASTAVCKKSLNPLWNETFELWVHSPTMEAKRFTYTFCSPVTKQSRITVNIFNDKKRKRANISEYGSGFLGGSHFVVEQAIDIHVTSL